MIEDWTQELPVPQFFQYVKNGDPITTGEEGSRGKLQ